MSLDPMASASSRPGTAPRAGMPAFGAFGGGTQRSLLLEKAGSALRRSTPDSEALASSEDELDQPRPSNAGTKPTKSGRRTSWLNEVPQNRKPSMSASGPYSPTASHPTTPGIETGAWNPNPGSVFAWPNSTTGYQFGSNIWSDNARKDPPARLQELSPHGNDPSIPFSIPLQPTPKTYRSQSYSVGQLENGGPGQPISTSAEATRSRLGTQYPFLQRRSSRPVGVGDRGNEGGGLGQVREDEDDEEVLRRQQELDTNESHARIKRLERENARLRQAAHSRDRTTSTVSPSANGSGAFSNPRLPESSVAEDLAREGFSELTRISSLPARQLSRRLSEQYGAYDNTSSQDPDGHASDVGKKAPHWQSSLGFGVLPDIPQSRRHSLAEVPTRHGSFSSNDPHDLANYGLGVRDIQGSDNPMYFNSTDSSRRAAEASIRETYATDPYSPQSQYGHYTAPPSQPLHIVNFKCCRSDVFYIQDGTGLQVQSGDLVIVEADRGTDLGAVQHTNVTWEEARRYKEYYAEEHYKWLMMFSQQSRNGGPNVVNPNGLPTRPAAGPGGMGPSGYHGPHDVQHPELKPKMIKRLAQNHEIQALKDKEGNEAKAKRVCQQKVQDHRLNMEILDAEFQMDSKKLTFYYFADTYINFNALVTDLFKIYKTRIWMSAINPASFQTPTASLGITPAFGGAFPSGQEQHVPRRRPFNPAASAYDEAERAPPTQPNSFAQPYYNPYSSVGVGPQQMNPDIYGYPQSMTSPFMAQSYSMLNPHATDFSSGRPTTQSSYSRSAQSPGQDWSSRFQGLSLNS